MSLEYKWKTANNIIFVNDFLKYGKEIKEEQKVSLLEKEERLEILKSILKDTEKIKNQEEKILKQNEKDFSDFQPMKENDRITGESLNKIKKIKERVNEFESKMKEFQSLNEKYYETLKKSGIDDLGQKLELYQQFDSIGSQHMSLVERNYSILMEAMEKIIPVNIESF